MRSMELIFDDVLVRFNYVVIATVADRRVLRTRRSTLVRNRRKVTTDATAGSEE